MKTTGSIRSIIHGVSTQTPRDRVEGQCWSLVNFIPDPTDGLVRRPGCKHDGSGSFSATGALQWRDISLSGVDYHVGCAGGHLTFIKATTGESIPTWQATSSVTYFSGGMVAATSVGDYVVAASAVKPALVNIAGQQTSAPAGKYYCMVEVKQGVYAGIYSIIRRSTGVVLATFTVPNGTTGTDITQGQPQFIAGKLRDGIAVAAGITQAIAANGIVSIESSDATLIADLAVDDGAYNSRARLVYNQWNDTASLPSVAPNGMVVRIGRLDKSLGDFYMQFRHSTTPTNYLNPRTGEWVECMALGTQDGGSLDGTTMPRLIRFVSGKIYIGTGPEIKAQVLVDTGTTLVDLDWGTRTVGDASSNEDPLFVGHTIKWLGTFQDRLVIVADNSATMSRISDYLELYLSTVVQLLDDDAVNMSSTFDAKDVLTGACLLDRNLIILGTRTHYMVPGKTPVTPSSGMAVTAAYESSPTVHPVLLEDGVYFCSVSDVNADVLCIQPKQLIDSTQVNSVASHVDGWLPGDITRLKASPKLDILFALSDSGNLYCYRTKFIEQKRALSSWFMFQFGVRAGAKLVSIVVDVTKVHMLFTRVSGTTVYYEAASLDLDRKGYLAAGSQYYLDFWTVESLASGTTALSDNRANTVLNSDYAVINPSTGNTTGTVTEAGGVVTRTLTGAVANAVTGMQVSYEYVPTMPLAKDSQGTPTALGKLTVGQMQMTYSYGSKFDITVTDKYRNVVREHTAARVGTSTAVLGHAYIGEGKAIFPVGTAEPEARVTISGKNHFPLVFTYIDWTGQYFKHGRSM